MTSTATWIQRSKLVVVFLLILTLFIWPISSVSGQVEGNDRDINVVMSTQTTQISPGDSVSVTVSVQNSGDLTSPAPVFHIESLPSGWNIISWSGTDATYRSATNDWLWTVLQGHQSKEFTIVLQSSENAESLSVSGEVVDGYDNSETDRLEVGIKENDNSDDSDDDDDSGGGGGSTPAQPIEEPVSEDTTTIETETVSVSEKATEGEVVSVDIPEQSITATKGSKSLSNLERLDIKAAENTQMNVDITDEKVDAPGANDDEERRDILSSISVNYNGGNSSSVDSATLTFTYTIAELQGYDLGSIFVRHQKENGNTTIIDPTTERTSQEYIITAKTDTFSTFSVVANPSTNTSEDSNVTQEMSTESSINNSTNADTSEETPGFGFISGSIAILACLVLLYNRSYFWP